MLCVNAEDLANIPITFQNSIFLDVYTHSGNSNIFSSLTDSDNIYHFENISFSGDPYLLSFFNDSALAFDYSPDIYDYYIFASAYSEVSYSDFTFAPDRIDIKDFNCDDGKNTTTLIDFSIFHHDSKSICGFSVFAKLPLISNSMISSFDFIDFDSGKTIPSSFDFYGYIIPVVKDGSSVSFDALVSKLDSINESINNGSSSITQAVEAVQNAIDSQYSMSQSEDFGVGNLTQSAEEKLGILNFASTTMVDFLDLFSPATASSAGTALIFPGFSMEIQGVSYEIWHDVEFDFSSIESAFPELIAIVRIVLVAMCWLAFFNYLWRSFEHIINGGRS